MFGSLDSNNDGKITRSEAMAYQKSTESCSCTGNANSTAKTSNSEQLITKRIPKLLRAYSSTKGSGNIRQQLKLADGLGFPPRL